MKVKKDNKNDPNKLYEIEEILDNRYNETLGTKEYLIKWKGYSDSDNTWEVEKNISKVLLKKYNIKDNIIKPKKNIKESIKQKPTKVTGKISEIEIVSKKLKINKDKKIDNKKLNDNKINKFLKSIKDKDEKSKDENIIITNELSTKIEKIIKIVYENEPIYDNLSVIVKLDGKICNFSIKEAEIKFPNLIIKYLDKKSIFN